MGKIIFGLLVAAVVFGFGYLVTGMVITANADVHSEVNYEVPIYAIDKSNFVERQTSGKTTRDVEVNRYNYTVEENGKYNVYHVAYEDASLVETTGQEKIVFYKAVYNNPKILKYFSVPPNTRYKNDLYLNKSTLQSLGIKVKQ